MKRIILSILIACSLISLLKAQISAPAILYADSSAIILHAGILVEKGEEYHLVSRKKNFGIIHYRMDTLFQLLEENATHVSSSVEETFELADGSRIVSGYFRSVDNRSAVQATKFDSTGTEVWQARSDYFELGVFGGKGVMDEQGNLWLAGRRRELGEYEAITLSMVDAQGNLLWEKEYPSIYGAATNGIIRKPNGNLWLLATEAYGDSSIWLLETTAAGDSVSEMKLGSQHDRAVELLTSVDGFHYIIAEGQPQMINSRHLKVWKLTNQGQVVWESSYHFEDDSTDYRELVPYRARPTSDGGCIIYNIAVGGYIGDSAYNSIYLLKVGPNGEKHWHLIVEHPDVQSDGDILPLADGGYLLTIQRGNALFPTYYARLSDDGTPAINVSRELELQELAVAIHPNPFDTELRGSIQLERPEEVEVAIYDLQGRQLRAQNLSGQAGRNAFVFPTDHLPPASYLIRVSGPKGQWSQVVVKQ
jgi:hypothetical protein